MIEQQELINKLINDTVTMVTQERFETIINHTNKISDTKGDIVECGVWKGGMSIFLSKMFPNKNIWVCDSYEGFQPLENAKHSYDKERHTPNYTHNAIGPLSISLEEVQYHFKSYGLEKDIDTHRIKFLKGFVKDTLPTSNINDIALLRIDVDAYSATLETLEELYSKVQIGGYIIFDDSCLYETLDAIKFFFEKNNIDPYLLDPQTDKPLYLYDKHTIDDSGFTSGCYIIKK
jgi:O-methyltransferase